MGAESAYDIVISHVSMSYMKDKSIVKVLDDVSLDVREKEFISIIGPSGSGKTTLLRIIAGLVQKPSSGNITIQGESVTTAVKNREVGVVFQRPALMPWRTVLKNVLLPMEIQGAIRKEHVDRAREILKFMALSEFENAYPGMLSGGMQQLVGIARALVFGPRILLMDEPFGALDAMTRQKMGSELLRIWTQYKKTVFFITHDISEAVLLSDRVVVFSKRPARIKRIINIELGRPRVEDIQESNEFLAYRRELRGLLEARE